MKLLPTLRYRRLIFAGMLLVVLSLGTTSTILSSSAQAQTPPAPSGAANAETDKETGKPIVTTPSGLKYVDLVVGTGPAVKTGDHVSVTYVGKLLDGTKFDASADHPDMGPTFDYVQGVTSLIAGWTEGTSTMKVGGKRKLIIPPQLGYGMQGAGDAVPPNATLIFEIAMVADSDAAKK
jgi:FKBP-type peptidyl-prolyl cis-trans isomerase